MYKIRLVSLRLVRDRSLPYAGQPFTDARNVHEFLRDFIADRDREVVLLLCLDTKNRLTCLNEVSIGTVTQALVNPGEIFKVALLSNATNIILAHNHPSGDPAPSRDDEEITRRVKQAGDLLHIRLLDHIIVGDGAFFSFAQEGRL